MKRMILIAISAAVLTVAAVAQPAPPDEGRPPKERLRKRIEIVRIWKLIETLELTEEQSMRFFPVLSASDRAKEEFKSERDRLLNRIAELVRAGDADEKELSAILDTLEQIRLHQFEAETAFLAEIDKILTVKQKAKLALFEKAFREEVRGLIETGIGREHGKPVSSFRGKR